MKLPAPIEDYIPQKGKMGFAQTLVKVLADEGESEAVINADNIFLSDNRSLSSIALIEYINQLNAAIQQYNSSCNTQSMKQGLFVGLQEAEFIQPVLKGDCLTMKAVKVEEVGHVTFIQGAVYRAGEPIARLVTKLYEIKDPTKLNVITNYDQIPKYKEDKKLNVDQPPDFLGSAMHRKLYSYTRNMIIQEECISFEIAFPNSFEAFDGHFPENAILPGIILLEVGKFALELFFSKPVVVTCIKKMKIGNAVLPNQVIACVMKIDAQSDSSVSFSTVFKDCEGKEISRFSGACNEGKDK